MAAACKGSPTAFCVFDGVVPEGALHFSAAPSNSAAASDVNRVAVSCLLLFRVRLPRLSGKR